MKIEEYCIRTIVFDKPSNLGTKSLLAGRISRKLLGKEGNNDMAMMNQ